MTVDPSNTLSSTLVTEVGPSNRGVEDIAMAADDTTLYYATEKVVAGNTGIYRRVLAGSVAEQLAPADRPGGIAIDDSHIYWTEYDLGEIKRFPRCL